MPLDTGQIQIMQVRVDADGVVYHVEFPVPKLGNEIASVTVTGLGDPKKLSGDWSCVPLEREVWKDLT